MKKLGRIMTLCIALAMVFSLCLTGCGKQMTAESLRKQVTAESLMSRYVNADLDALAFDEIIDMDISTVTFGHAADAKMTGTMRVESAGNTACMISDMHSETVGMSESDEGDDPVIEDVHMTRYLTENNGSYTLYTLDGETGMWYKEDGNSADAMKFSDAVSKVSTEDLELTEEETEYVLTGKVDLAKAQEIFGDTFDLSSLAEIESVDLTKIEKGTIVYRFDKKTRDLKSMDLDLTQMMQSIMDESLRMSLGLLAGEGLEDENADGGSDEKVDIEQFKALFSVTISSFSMHQENFCFDKNVVKVELPQAALNAQPRTDTTGK